MARREMKCLRCHSFAEALRVCERDRVIVDFGDEHGGVAIYDRDDIYLEPRENSGRPTATSPNFEDAVAHYILAKHRGGADAPTEPA